MSDSRLIHLAVLLVVGAASAGEEPVTVADLVLREGTVVTVDDRIGTVEALAVVGDRIAAVGDTATIDAWIGAGTTIIDLDGRLAIPGFIEGHGHFVGLGESKMNLDLMRARSWEEIVTMVAEAVSRRRPGEWITGRGWHQEKWDRTPSDSVEGFPSHHDLSAVSPENPVLLVHASGHASLANKMAMEVSGISGSTPDPPGGEILRDESGVPTGVLRERASGLVTVDSGPRRHSRRQRMERLRTAIELAGRECVSKGVTSFQDAGSTFAVIDTFRSMALSGDLEVRLWVMVRERNELLRANIDDYKLAGLGAHHLTVGGLKRSIDGALGSRGAWLLEPYADQAESTGLATATVEDVEETAEIALASGLQLCVHAIGDRANREVLDLYDRSFASRAEGPALRWRIEHAQHLHPDDIPRFAPLGVIAAMQGVHCTSDGPWVVDRLGERRAREGAYVWRSLQESGAVVSNGTDAPVEDVDPIASFHATVSRRLSDGSRFFPEQRLSRMEALRTYTINAAFAAFEEDLKGTLTPSKLADIVVLDRNILTVPEEEIPATRVDCTIVGGRVVYDRMIRTVESFRAAVDAGRLDAARGFLSEDPRTWYGSKEGAGAPWTLGTGRWKTWDDEFNGESKFGPWHVGDRRVYAVGVESNDYYRAIERDPSPWLLTYFFDRDGRIEGRMVSPVPEDLRPPGEPRPDRGDEFDRWLRERHPTDHGYLRPDGKIDPTGDRAARTRARLKQWRREIGLPPLEEE